MRTAGSAAIDARRDGIGGRELLWGALVAGYCLALVRYGFELADEGLLLAQIDRVAHGQVPYRDFHVGYGPALFWLHATTFAWFGASATTVRVGLVLVHAARTVLLVHLGRAAGGWWPAGLVVAFVGFFLPVAPGVCVPGNIPYPGWFADLLGLSALLLLARERPPLLAIGALWGVVFAFKQNGGVLGLGAAALTTILIAPASPDGGRGLAVATGIALVAGAVLLLHEYLDPLLALVFLVPLGPLAWAVSTRRVTRATLGALVRLGAGFVLVAGTVVGWMVSRAGAAAVATEFLQIGGDTIRTYHAAHPTLAGLLAAIDGAPLARAVRLLADASWFVIFPAVHLAGAMLVAGGRIRSRLDVALIAAAALGYLQLYPRMDFWHLLPLAPVSLATLALVVTSVGPPVVVRMVPALLVVLALGRMLPAMPVLAGASVGAPDPPRIPRLDLRWDQLRDERLTRLPEVVEAVTSMPRVAGFPALAAVNFALGKPSPWRHDYFFPGRPLPDEERALAAEALRDPPDAVVVLDAPGGAFDAAFAAHPVLVEALERGFVEQRRIGPYRVLVPRRAAQ